jgi:hypothetical protein
VAIGELYSERRSPLLWAAVLSGIWVLAGTARAISNRLLFPAWIELRPAPVLSKWLLETPLAFAAPDVRHFSLFIPDVLVALLAGGVIGAAFPKHRWQLGGFLGLAFLVVSHVAGGFPTCYVWRFATDGRWARVVVLIVFTAVILGSMACGLALAAWMRGRRTQVSSRTSGDRSSPGGPSKYAPSTEDVVGECCTDIRAAHNATPSGSSLVLQRSWLASRAMRIRVYCAVVLLAIFYMLDWTSLQYAVGEMVRWSFELLSFDTQRGWIDGVPIVAIEGHWGAISAHCTMLDLAFVAAPFTVAAQVSLRRNIGRVLLVLIGVLLLALVRIWIADYLRIQGVPWAYAHDVPYVALYSVVLVVVTRAGAVRERRQERE